MLILHGLADPSVPVEGGIRTDRESTRVYEGVAAAVDFWSVANRVAGGPVRNELAGGMAREESWLDAQGRCGVRLCLIDGLGHEWPGGSFARGMPEGHPLKTFDGAAYIWELLRGHRRARAGEATPMAGRGRGVTAGVGRGYG